MEMHAIIKINKRNKNFNEERNQEPEDERICNAHLRPKPELI